MLSNLFGGPLRKLTKAFERASDEAPAGPLQEFYQAGLPDFDAPISQIALAAIDLETDGLDAASHAVLEAGIVDMDAYAIHGPSAQRIRFRPDVALNADAVVIHRITDDAAAAAQPIEQALADVLTACAGKVLVAHFAEIESGFLDAACKRLYGTGFVAPFICTMQLETRLFPRQFAQDGLRLSKLRGRYGLPPYRAHDGLTDAVACGELLLAQLAHSARHDPPLAEILRR